MTTKLILIFAVTAAVLGFQSKSCQPREERIIHMSPEVSAQLVFFFKKGTTPQEIFEFQRSVIGIPNPKGSGYSSLPGMMTVVALTLDGFDGEAINFQPDATDAQKAFVKERVLESPLVHKVYDNVVPTEIKGL